MTPAPRDKRKPVVLLSGGLDSAVCLALNPGADALKVDYQQPHWREEGHAARLLAKHYGASLRYASFYPALAVTCDDSAMVVPNRNLILLGLAATLGRPVIGCNADDHANYVDCRPEFFQALKPIIDADTPLLYMTKPEIGRLARDLGVPVDLTWSCYYPTEDGPCEECDACKGRERALA